MWWINLNVYHNLWETGFAIFGGLFEDFWLCFTFVCNETGLGFQ